MNPVALLSANVGRPLVRGPLALFPVFTSAVPAERYRTGPGAARRHTLTVHEADGGNRQNLTINVSVLVPAGATITIPVSCVEQGRWGSAKKASRSVNLAPARLR
ncbi:MAG: hypothetical protein M3Q68_09410, partial [Actinomycetota bacterium]|nr:hypothetical protein [Actinomycetota bacterium]